ncbi:MAG: NCS2 family permease [Deltaproteobacteria bacterium]|jgi:AGZA family xanthine/uracil permease-like MFS transporter|nr:NCS2 family permease [Deltaproteobacteria bacterium]
MFASKNSQIRQTGQTAPTRALVEISAGLTTFVAMVYVLAANPMILGLAGLPQSAVFTATALGTILATLIMAFYANLPFAVAPGMGLNVFFMILVTQMGYSPAQAITAVLVSGSVFFLLSLSPLRQKFLDEIPQCLRLAVSSGVGLMIAYIGLYNSAVVVSTPSGPGLGNLTQGPALLAVLGLFVLGALLALRFRYAVLAGVIITTLIGLPLGVTRTEALSAGIFSPPPALEGLVFNFDFTILGSWGFWSLVVTLLIMEFIDGLAGFLGLFSVMGAEAERYKHKLGRAFVADSLGVVVGSCLGLSPNTTYCESGTGVAVGGRTGLTAVTVAVCFFFALFISPLFLMVPAAAVAPALVLVGLLMLSSVAKINFQDFSESFPVFLVLLMITLTWRISDSLAVGWLAYALMKILMGRAQTLTPTVWVGSIIFGLKLFWL